MTLNYSVVGFDSIATNALSTKLSRLGSYALVGAEKEPEKLIDIVLANFPNLIFINLDNYGIQEFNESMNLMAELYRSNIEKPRLIAMSSSEKWAFNCMQNNFYYYLLNPVDELELQKLNSRLKSSLSISKKTPKKLCIKSYGDYNFIEVEDILYLKADNNTTEIFMANDKKVVAFKTLKHFENILPTSFCRIHQSFIINKTYISRINLGKHQCHLNPLKFGLPFSKSYRKVMTKLAFRLSHDSIS